MNRLEAELFIDTHANSIWKNAQNTFKDLKDKEMPKIEYPIKSAKWAGLAWRYGHKIEFNIAFLCTLENPNEFIKTIAHELSHIITWRLYPNAKQSHGPEFKWVMKMLGYNGNTYHTYSVSKAKNAVERLKNEDVLLSL